MRADLQRFYNLNLDGMGDSFTVSHAAACFAALPAESACLSHLNPEATGWRVTEVLLAHIADTVSLLLWAQTEDGQQNRNRPKPIPRPWAVSETSQANSEILDADIDEIKTLLKKPRT